MVNWSEVNVSVGGQDITLLALVKRLDGSCDPFDTTKDDEYSLYLQMAGEAAEIYTQNTLAKRSVTETKPFSTEEAYLTYWPYDDGLTVTIDGEDKTADYTVFRRDKLAYAVSETCHPTEDTCYRQMELTYTAGYDPLPTELGYVIARSALAYGAQTGAAGQIKKQVIDGVGSVEYAIDTDQPATFGVFSSASLTVLDMYKAVKLHV